MLERSVKITDNFRYELEAIHVRQRINTSAVVKKGNGTQRQKVHDARTITTVDGKKAPLRPKQCQMVKKISQ